MDTTDNMSVIEKIAEINRRKELLLKLKEKHNNPDGFDMLIADLEERKAKLLATKIN